MGTLITVGVTILGSGFLLTVFYFFFSYFGGLKQRDADKSTLLKEGAKNKKEARKDAKNIADMSDDELDDLLSK